MGKAGTDSTQLEFDELELVGLGSIDLGPGSVGEIATELVQLVEVAAELAQVDDAA